MAKPKRGQSTATIDGRVGGRIRERRIMLGLTQQQLAEMIGVTSQQAHKYERGINRVSAGRLFEIAHALSAPITYFYEGIGEEGSPQITLHQRMQLEIARNFAEIRSERHQEAVSQVARALASKVTQSSSATGELLSLSAGQTGSKSARSFDGTDGAPRAPSWVRLRAPPGIGSVQTFSGLHINVGLDGAIEMSAEDAQYYIRDGWTKLAGSTTEDAV
jgi:transcriptional regulator with XRE-family HTH domain